MSGYKRSNVRIKPAAQNDLNSRYKAEATKRQLNGLQFGVNQIVDRTSSQLGKAADSAISKAQNWINELLNKINDPKNKVDELDITKRQGESILTDLMATEGPERSGQVKELTSDLIKATILFKGNEEIITTWLPDKVDSCKSRLQQCDNYLKVNDLPSLSKFLPDTKFVLNMLIDDAEKLENKHIQRMQVLDSLRKVCKELGFSELIKSADIIMNKRDDIIYEVNTFANGNIKFTLTLDIIKSDSAITEGRCLNEFDKISKLLEDEYSIQTKFRPEGSDEEPEDKQKDALEEPNIRIALERGN